MGRGARLPARHQFSLVPLSWRWRPRPPVGVVPAGVAVAGSAHPGRPPPASLSVDGERPPAGVVRDRRHNGHQPRRPDRPAPPARAGLPRPRRPRPRHARHRAGLLPLRRVDEPRRSRSQIYLPLDARRPRPRPGLERPASRHVLHRPARKGNGHALAIGLLGARTRPHQPHFGTGLRTRLARGTDRDVVPADPVRRAFDENPPHADDVAGTCFTGIFRADAFSHLLARRHPHRTRRLGADLSAGRTRPPARRLELVLRRIPPRLAVAPGHDRRAARHVGGRGVVPRAEELFPPPVGYLRQ